MDKAIEELLSKFSLSLEDVLNIIKTASLFAVSALLTYIVEHIDEIEMSEEVLVFVPVIVLILKAIIDWINKYAYKEKEEKAVVTAQGVLNV
jgi:hypothetical protein